MTIVLPATRILAIQTAGKGQRCGAARGPKYGAMKCIYLLSNDPSNRQPGNPLVVEKLSSWSDTTGGCCWT